MNIFWRKDPCLVEKGLKCSPLPPLSIRDRPKENIRESYYKNYYQTYLINRNLLNLSNFAIIGAMLRRSQKEVVSCVTSVTLTSKKGSRSCTWVILFIHGITIVMSVGANLMKLAGNGGTEMFADYRLSFVIAGISKYISWYWNSANFSARGSMRGSVSFGRWWWWCSSVCVLVCEQITHSNGS